MAMLDAGLPLKMQLGAIQIGLQSDDCNGDDVLVNPNKLQESQCKSRHTIVFVPQSSKSDDTKEQVKVLTMQSIGSFPASETFMDGLLNAVADWKLAVLQPQLQNIESKFPQRLVNNI